MHPDSHHGYDALLIVSFGGPEGPDEVLPFLRNVTRGRDVPDARLEEVAGHYHELGGRSPINDQNRALIAALEQTLTADGPDLPVYWGNRNWHPLLADTLRTMAADRVRHAACFVTSAFSSYSGCRQYREDLAAARAEVGPDAPELDKLRVFYNHPGFVASQVDLVHAALAELPDDVRDEAQVMFTTHSIPLTMARHCDYEAQHREACRLVMERVGRQRPWDLVYNSRSGPPQVPWLEPDVNDHLRILHDRGVPAVVVAPIGFLSDHLEVRYDLDVEARATAEELGMAFARGGTVGTDPRFVAMIAELVRERLDPGHQRRFLGTRGPSHDVCPADCCLTPGQRPAPVVSGPDPAGADPSIV